MEVFANEFPVNKGVRRRPLLTCSLMVVNVIMLIYTFYKADWVMEDPSLNPMLGPPASVLHEVGGVNVYLVKDLHEYWRLFAAMFLHAGIIHVLVNNIALYRLGTELERE